MRQHAGQAMLLSSSLGLGLVFFAFKKLLVLPSTSI